MVMDPVFPVTVYFDDGTTWVLDTSEKLGWTLEWFDSNDGNDIRVVDAHGRPVSVKVEALEIKRLKVQDKTPPTPPRRRRARAA